MDRKPTGGDPHLEVLVFAILVLALLIAACIVDDEDDDW